MNEPLPRSPDTVGATIWNCATLWQRGNVDFTEFWRFFWNFFFVLRLDNNNMWLIFIIIKFDYYKLFLNNNCKRNLSKISCVCSFLFYVNYRISHWLYNINISWKLDDNYIGMCFWEHIIYRKICFLTVFFYFRVVVDGVFISYPLWILFVNQLLQDFWCEVYCSMNSSLPNN